MLESSTIESLFMEGCSLADIGRQYGISRERVRQILAASGKTAKDLQAELDVNRKEIIEPLADKQFARFEIAQHTGLTICQVDRICRIFNIQTMHKKS